MSSFASDVLKPRRSSNPLELICGTSVREAAIRGENGMKLGLIAAVVVSTVVALLPQTAAIASAPACYTYGGSGYCEYTGSVAKAYINSNGELLIYFDTPVDPASVSGVGITGVTNFTACAFPVTQNPDYAKMLFAAALSAQARQTSVTLQLWGTYAGYLKCDRIWSNS